MQTEIYNKCKIISTPHNVLDQGEYKYSVHGVIQYDTKEFIRNVPEDLLSVSKEEWLHLTEEEADSVFIKYAKKWIDQNIEID